ncbi:hypothetical protein NLG97_g3771 [Lecanicillium saksenae]|uniref:Uncharacterized protein n=1 Tax=Lecanicillium saksenae TaxID=468837 RepID=A0ACC1QXR7_9HYPO|nr:hypothetical protein NLG97_g3771 [Lecanicillium saksenae]
MGVIEKALEKGWPVTVPDFLGPKSAFLANVLAGHAVLDGVRATLAASSFTQLAAEPAVALGDTQEAITGAALGGTCPDILSVMYTINKSVYSGLIATGVVGLANEYPEVASLVAAQLKPEKKSTIDRIRGQCLGAAVISFMFQDIFSYVKDPSIFNGTVVKQVVAENNMGQSAPRIPLMVYKGAKDEISPVADTDKLVQWYCGGGTSVEYRRLASEGHLGLLANGAPAALAWLSDRLNGVAAAPGVRKGGNIFPFEHSSLDFTGEASFLSHFIYWELWFTLGMQIYENIRILALWVPGGVGMYSKAKLTKGSDRLPALSGVAARQHEITKDGYLAGLWRRLIERQLTWDVEDPMERPPWRAPSWTWAAVDGESCLWFYWKNLDLADHILVQGLLGVDDEEVEAFIERQDTKEQNDNISAVGANRLSISLDCLQDEVVSAGETVYLLAIQQGERGSSRERAGFSDDDMKIIEEEKRRERRRRGEKVREYQNEENGDDDEGQKGTKKWKQTTKMKGAWWLTSLFAALS